MTIRCFGKCNYTIWEAFCVCVFHNGNEERKICFLEEEKFSFPNSTPTSKCWALSVGNLSNQYQHWVLTTTEFQVGNKLGIPGRNEERSTLSLRVSSAGDCSGRTFGPELLFMNYSDYDRRHPKLINLHHSHPFPTHKMTSVGAVFTFWL